LHSIPSSIPRYHHLSYPSIPVRVNGHHDQKVASAVGSFHKLLKEVSEKNEKVEVAGNIGVGFEMMQRWRQVLGSNPGDFKAPIPFEGSAGIIPATGGDLFLRS
jgi:hypothetical protein